MPYTNAEKQERYRKKEWLVNYGNQIIAQTMGSINPQRWYLKSKAPAEIQNRIERIVDLPSGWTDEDFENAKNALYNIQLDFYDNPHLLSNDIQAGRSHNGINEVMLAKDPNEALQKQKRAIADAQKLVALIISSFELTDLHQSDLAAVVMEVMRYVGRLLTDMKDIPKSHATAMCFACIGKQFEKPEWLAEVLVDYLGCQMEKPLRDEVAKRLAEFKG